MLENNMQTTTTMPQSSAGEPVKLRNIQLVIVECLWVLTWSGHSENEQN